MNGIIEVQNLVCRYNGKFTALDGIDLSIRNGEMLAVIGSNGSGKSTLLMAMAGLVKPHSGHVIFNGKMLTEKTLHDPFFVREFRSRVGFVFQDPDAQLFCPTVRDELLFGPLQLGLTDTVMQERISEVSRMLNIESLLNRPPYMLSGGEKKRVAIGSVLVTNPDVLLLDEPTGGLDPKTQAFLMELVFALTDAGKTIIITTHDLSLVEDLEPRVAVLSEEHTLVKTGTAADILADNEFLIGVNLIHEHIHRHGGRVHKHPHGHFGGGRHGH